MKYHQFAPIQLTANGSSSEPTLGTGFLSWTCSAFVFSTCWHMSQLRSNTSVRHSQLLPPLPGYQEWRTLELVRIT